MAGVVVVIARFLVQLLAAKFGSCFFGAFGEPTLAVGQVFEPCDCRAVVVGDELDAVYLVGQVEIGVAVMAQSSDPDAIEVDMSLSKKFFISNF